MWHNCNSPLSWPFHRAKSLSNFAKNMPTVSGGIGYTAHDGQETDITWREREKETAMAEAVSGGIVNPQNNCQLCDRPHT